MNTLRRFYRLSRPFWSSRAQWLAWAMLASVIGLGLLIVPVNVLINGWSKRFYDTLAAFEGDALCALVGEYTLYLGGYVLLYVALDYIRKALVLRWRQALTARLIDAWLADQAFYRLGLAGEPDNPDQRIAQDVDLMVDLSIELVASLVINLAQVGAFVVILWNLLRGADLRAVRPQLDGAWLPGVGRAGLYRGRQQHHPPDRQAAAWPQLRPRAARSGLSRQPAAQARPRRADRPVPRRGGRARASGRAFPGDRGQLAATDEA